MKRILLLVMALACIPTFVWAKSYVISVGQHSGESVGTTCDAEDRCRIKLLLYPDSPSQYVLTTSVQFIDENVFIFFKSADKYLFASPYKHFARKKYASYLLDKNDRLKTEIHLYEEKPELDDGIFKGKDSEIASVFVKIRPDSTSDKKK